MYEIRQLQYPIKTEPVLVTIFESNSHYPWSEPVRLKPGLGKQFQHFFTTSPISLIAPENITESRWHQPWSEPVRFRIDRKLAIALSVSPFIHTAFPIPRTNAALAATETKDTFAATTTAAQVTIYSGFVSVEEIASNSGAATSIVEG